MKSLSLFERLSRNATVTCEMEQEETVTCTASVLAELSLANPVFGASAIQWPGAYLVRIPRTYVVGSNGTPAGLVPYPAPSVLPVNPMGVPVPVASSAVAVAHVQGSRLSLDAPAAYMETDPLEEIQPVRLVPRQG